LVSKTLQGNPLLFQLAFALSFLLNPTEIMIEPKRRPDLRFSNTRMQKKIFTNYVNGKKSILKRPLNEFPVFIRYNESIEIIKKINYSSL